VAAGEDQAGSSEQTAVLEAMQEQHAVIDPGIAAVRAAFDALQNASGTPAQVADALRALGQAVGEHFANEERDAVPILARTLTPQDLNRFSRQQQRRAGGLKGGAAFLPWLVDGLPTDQRKKALATFPPPLRLLITKVFVRTYRKAAPALYRGVSV